MHEREIALLLDEAAWIRALARTLCADPHAAEDLVQDTWVAALELRPRVDRPLRGWLATVLRRIHGRGSAQAQAVAARERAVARPEPQPSTLEVVERAARQRDLVEAVLALEEPYRETLLLRFFEQLSYAAIAERHGVRAATVNSRITRALTQLRERLDGRFGGRDLWLRALAPLAAPLPVRAAGAGLGAALLATLLAVTAVAAFALTRAPAPPGPPDSVRAPAAIATGDARAGAPEASVPPSASDAAGAVALEPTRAPEGASPSTAGARWSVDVSTDYYLSPELSVLLIEGARGDVELLPGSEGVVRLAAHVEADPARVPAHARSTVFDDHLQLVERGERLHVIETRRAADAPYWRVSYVVQVPPSLALVVSSHAGRIVVRCAPPWLSAASTGAGILVEGDDLVLGETRLDAARGDIEVRVRALAGPLSARSKDGHVHLTLARLPHAPLRFPAQAAAPDLPAALDARLTRDGDDWILPTLAPPATTPGPESILAGGNGVTLELRD